MKIAIISAVLDEIKTLHNDMHFQGKETVAEREFYFGEHLGHEIVLVYSQIGKVAGSITATILIERFNVDLVIFTGLAGAVKGHLNRGDIVLAKETYQHDYDCRPIAKEQFENPISNRRLYATHANSLSLAKQAIETFLLNLFDYVPENEFMRLELTKPKLYIGTIATGDQFIQDVSQYPQLEGEILTDAVEMEGAAVAQVATEYGIPYILIRIISDNANNQAHDSLNEFSEVAASKYSSGIVQEIIKTI